jgi:hypothetical protein
MIDMNCSLWSVMGNLSGSFLPTSWATTGNQTQKQDGRSAACVLMKQTEPVLEHALVSFALTHQVSSLYRLKMSTKLFRMHYTLAHVTLRDGTKTEYTEIMWISKFVTLRSASRNRGQLIYFITCALYTVWSISNYILKMSSWQLIAVSIRTVKCQKHV